MENKTEESARISTRSLNLQSQIKSFFGGAMVFKIVVTGQVHSLILLFSYSHSSLISFI